MFKGSNFRGHWDGIPGIHAFVNTSQTGDRMDERHSQELERLEHLVDRLENAVVIPANRRAEMYREALEDTVKILLQTKNAFRSKQLQELRERIERVLDN